jgi:hypothetical protein
MNRKIVIFLVLLFFIQSATFLTSLTPPAGKALVYIIRDSYLGKPFAYKVTIDDVKIGSTYGGTYIYAFIKPGKHEINSKSDVKSKLEITVDAGKTYYVRQKVFSALAIGAAKLELLDNSEGEDKLSKCKISKDNDAGGN